MNPIKWFINTDKEPYAFLRFITGLQYFNPSYESYYWKYVILSWLIIIVTGYVLIFGGGYV